jgi:hypothetical protein
MEVPFAFGKLVQDDDFTDRIPETKRLISNFESSINTILISPRRWGKSSLVGKATEQFRRSSSDFIICMIDLNNVRSEEQFYMLLATKVLQASASRIDSVFENAKSFLGRFILNLSFSPDPGTELKLSMNWDEVKRDPDDILDLAENIAIKVKKKLILCIDEFQNISEFEDSIGFQRKLRSHWQLHQHVSYCLSGSKRHMLMEVFSSPSMPFYKFSDLIFLQKITEKEWITFITERFEGTGKTISNTAAGSIARLCENHPYYVQQLSQQVWLRTENSCESEIVQLAFEDLVMQLSMLFQILTDDLTSRQINLLSAIIAGEGQLTSQRVLNVYNLGTSANALKVKKSLHDKEILDIVGKTISFNDPLYKYWLENCYLS